MVIEEHQHRIADEIGRGFMPREQDLVDDGQQLFGGQWRLAIHLSIHHDAEQIVGWLAASIFNSGHKIVMEFDHGVGYFAPSLMTQQIDIA